MTDFTKESFIAAKHRSEEIVENYNLLRNEEDAMNNRAYAQARQIVRKMIAEQSGSEYALLSPSGKADVNRVADAKVTAIKNVATQIIGKIKAKKPSTRLGSFVAGSKLDNEGAEEHGEFKESLNRLFSEKFKAPPKDDMDGKKKEPLIDPKSKKPNAITYFNKFGESVSNALLNKCQKSGISFDILGEVYCRGLETWNESVNISQQQYAFARVNSYINQGKTYFNEDADLHLDEHPNCGTPDCCGQCNEEEVELEEGDPIVRTKSFPGEPPVGTYADMRRKGTLPKPVQAKSTKEEVELGELVSPENKKKLAGKIAALRAQDIPPETLRKIAGKVYKKADTKLNQEAVLTEPQSKDPNKSSSRFRGTDSLTKIYKKDTPGQALNNSFEAMFNETVKSALKEPVIVPAIRKPDGTYTPARVEYKRTNKKIIGSGNVFDGEPPA